MKNSIIIRFIAFSALFFISKMIMAFPISSPREFDEKNERMVTLIQNSLNRELQKENNQVVDFSAQLRIKVRQTFTNPTHKKFRISSKNNTHKHDTQRKFCELNNLKYVHSYEPGKVTSKTGVLSFNEQILEFDHDLFKNGPYNIENGFQVFTEIICEGIKVVEISP